MEGRAMQWRPVAYVALRDESLRRQLSDALGGEGWMVITAPTGYHLVESMADVLLGRHTWHKPGLVVVDAVSPGCSGMTIARGLRDLGWSVPVVLIVHSTRERGLVGDIGGPDVRVLDAQHATDGLVAIARTRRRSPPEPWQPPGRAFPSTGRERQESN
jgi:CheY-like chemotaxis protein